MNTPLFVQHLGRTVGTVTQRSTDRRWVASPLNGRPLGDYGTKLAAMDALVWFTS